MLVLLGLTIRLALAVAGPADALTVDQIEAFSGQFHFIGVTPFDPAFGTLDRVRVNISGVLTVSGVTGLNVLPLGPVGAPVPVLLRPGRPCSSSHRFAGGIVGTRARFIDDGVPLDEIDLTSSSRCRASSRWRRPRRSPR
jgi:hypothetical protein